MNITQDLSELKIEDSKAFSYLYKLHFHMIKRFVVANSGSKEDAEDIFQDTMIVLLQKLRRDDFQVTASLKTYIMAIAKNSWFKKLRNKSQFKESEFTEALDNKFFDEVDLAIENEKKFTDKLYYHLGKITIHCQRLIQDIFFKEKTIDQIQKEYGYSTKHNAQNQKFKCVEQLKKAMDK